jgi:hypothetical protein
MYKIVAFVGIVLAGVFVAPMAASAVPYTPGATISADPVNLHPGDSSVISAGSGYFGPSEHVDVSVSGGTTSHATAHTLSVSGGWTVPDTLTSTSAGAASFSLTAPAGSHGDYTVTLTSASASGSVVLDVTPATSGGSGSNPGGGSGTIATTGTGGLAFTGLSLPMMVVWAILAIIALGAALVTVRRMKQRERTSH